MKIDLESCFVGFLIGVAIYLLLNCVFNKEGLGGETPTPSLTQGPTLTPQQAILQAYIDDCMHEIKWEPLDYEPNPPLFTTYTTFDFNKLSADEFNDLKKFLSSNNEQIFLSLNHKSPFLDIGGLTLSQVVQLVNCFQENIQGLMISLDDEVSDLSAINSLNNPGNLTWLYIGTKSGTTGDLTTLKRFTNLVYLSLDDLKITGNISSLSALTGLQYLEITGDESWQGGLNGDISAIKNFENLRHLMIGGNSKVVGDIKELSALTELKSLDLRNTNVTGDIDVLETFIKLDLDYIAVCPSKIYGNLKAGTFAAKLYTNPTQSREYWLNKCPQINIPSYI
jgi:hypothetical protein